MTTVNTFSDRVMAAYDADRSGAIEFRRLPRGEMTRRQERVEPEPGAHPFGSDHRLARVTTTWTQVSLFAAADTDDDGTVTRTELRSAVAAFDRDGDGELSSRGWAFWQAPGELDDLQRQHGEQIVRVERTPL